MLLEGRGRVQGAPASRRSKNKLSSKDALGRSPCVPRTALQMLQLSSSSSLPKIARKQFASVLG